MKNQAAIRRAMLQCRIYCCGSKETIGAFRRFRQSELSQATEPD
ncbi:hypothetical protein METH_21110 (plasmid) [Leisingera methylohalidivorans DSM 14336]|uniref:Uncharacterized protein n=1 Tax=Leisingera methylohalidivorans DSM 14336 TaxID=999552 RepID=V9W102_9RHOB|nr:hypothetical protein METH_21110 [Leisingera methylohalidivorans DSM 14336]